MLVNWFVCIPNCLRWHTTFVKQSIKKTNQLTCSSGSLSDDVNGSISSPSASKRLRSSMMALITLKSLVSMKRWSSASALALTTGVMVSARLVCGESLRAAPSGSVGDSMTLPAAAPRAKLGFACGAVAAT